MGRGGERGGGRGETRDSERYERAPTFFGAQAHAGRGH